MTRTPPTDLRVLRSRWERARFSWTFTRTLGHGRWRSLRQAVRNYRHLPKSNESQDERRLKGV